MKWFSNLSIRNKLVLSFTIFAFLAGLVGYVGLSGMYKMSDRSRIMYENHTKALSLLEKIVENMQRSRSNLLEVILINEKVRQKESDVKMRDRIDEVNKVTAQFKTLIDDGADSAVDTAYAAYTKSWEEFKGYLFQISDMAINNQRQQAEDKWFADADASRKKVSDALDALLAYHMRETGDLYDEQKAQVSSAIQEIMIVCMATLGLLFTIGFITIRAIRNPLTQLVEKASDIAEGNLTVTMDYESKDEIGALVLSFQKMTNNLKESLSQIIEASSAVASATTQISSSTEEMAAGAQQQSSQATEVSSAVEEMTKTIFENSRNASATLETASVAKEAALKGGKVVQDTISGMKEIASVVNKSAITVKALGVSSNQIGEITAVIDEIADQTNLLALNAAIEAARAGEQGRGFAVVADEVRKLAERTRKATKEIDDMIKQIQNDTSNAVTSMQEGTKKVDEGIRLADDAGKSLNDIVDVSQKVTDMVSAIASANEQQTSTSEEISQNVQGISGVTQQMATGLEQISSSSEDLNRLTENLELLAKKFKVSLNEDHTAFLTPMAHSSSTREKKSASKIHFHVKKPLNGPGNGHGSANKQTPKAKLFEHQAAEETVHENGHDGEESN